MAPRYVEPDDDDFDDFDDLDDEEEWLEPSSRMVRVPAEAVHLGLSLAEADRHPLHQITFLEWESAAESRLSSPSEIASWVEQQGLSSLLSAPASAELGWWLGWRAPSFLLAKVTVRQCLLGRLSHLSKRLREQYSSVIAGAARGYLRHAVQRRRLDELRRTLWARGAPAPFATLAESLQRLYAGVRSAPGCDGPVDIHGAALVIGDDPPRVIAPFPERQGGAGQAQVLFADHADGRVSLSCSCPQKPSCRHHRVLLEAVLDGIYGEGAFGAELAEVVRVPSWQRLLGALEAEGVQPAGEAPRERLVWRLGRSSDGLVVQPVLQQQSVRGGWSPGRKLQPTLTVQCRRQAPPEDRAALDAVIGAENLRYLCGRGAAELRLLEALIDHPRTCSLEPPHDPLRVRRATAAIGAELAGEGLELGLSVGGHRVAVEQLGALMIDERSGVLFAGAEALLFELDPRAIQVLQAAARYSVALPPEAHERTAELLSSLSVHVPIELPEALRGRRVPARWRPVLRLAPQGAGGLGAELRARSLDGGPDQIPGEGPLEVFAGAGDERVWTRRELEDEAARARALIEQLGLPAEPVAELRWQLEGDAALELVHRARALASAPEPELVVEWPASAPWETRSASPGHLRVRVERLGEWFGIGGSIEVDGAEISLAQLLVAVRAGQRFVQLAPGRFARVEAELAAAARGIDDMAHQHGQTLRLGPSSVVALEALELPQLDLATEWRALRARIEAARQLEPEPPAALQAALRPYQREGYRWLARLSAWDAGACLADDMGLGKTVQCLAVLLSRPGPHLVVAPTSVGPNWLREAAAFAPSLRARQYRGPDRAAILSDLAPGDLLVTSYDLMALDIEALSAVEFDTLVLDEAQAVKNAQTRRAKAAGAVRARFKLALTGTPVENHLGELWSIFSIISPSLLGPWEHFRDRFAAPIERDGERGRLEALSRLVRPFMLRRTKAVVAPELPPRTTVVEPVELSSRERALYEVARRDALSELAALAGDERGRIQILAALTRLRRLACHPQLVTEAYRGSSSKLDTLLRLVGELRESGQRALIFSQFTSFLALVRQALDKRRIDYLYLDGQTTPTERSALVDAWRAGEPAFFLLSLKAGGSGLNLTGADCVIHLDPWWNPAVEDQATDRTHRIGQQRPVTAIRLIAQGTIEEAVIALHEGKRSLADGLLSGTEAAGKLSSAELIDLIRFGEGALGEATAVGDEEDDEVNPDTDRASSAASRAARKGSGRRSSGAQDEARAEMASGPALDRDELRQLRERLDEHLANAPIRENSARTYLRAFDCLVNFARTRRGRRPLEAWCDECVAAIEAGQLDAPQSLPPFLRTAVRRAAALGDERSGRSSPARR